MVQKINGFEKTSQVFEEIDRALTSLKQQLVIKKQNVKNLQQAAEVSIKKIDNLVSELDKVIK